MKVLKSLTVSIGGATVAGAWRMAKIMISRSRAIQRTKLIPFARCTQNVISAQEWTTGRPATRLMATEFSGKKIWSMAIDLWYATLTTISADLRFASAIRCSLKDFVTHLRSMIRTFILKRAISIQKDRVLQKAVLQGTNAVANILSGLHTTREAASALAVWTKLMTLRTWNVARTKSSQTATAKQKMETHRITLATSKTATSSSFKKLPNFYVRILFLCKYCWPHEFIIWIIWRKFVIQAKGIHILISFINILACWIFYLNEKLKFWPDYNS